MTDILLKGAIYGVPEVVLRPFSNTLLYGHADITNNTSQDGIIACASDIHRRKAPVQQCRIL